MVLVFAGAIALFVFGLVSWRGGVYLAILLAIFDGGIRKWILPEFQQEVYFGSSILLAGSYLRFFASKHTRRGSAAASSPATLPIILTVYLVFIELANPFSPGLLSWIVGAHSYFIYVPLLYMTAYLVPSNSAIYKYIITFFVIALVPLLLAPIQFNLPPDHLLNRYATGGDVSLAPLGNQGKYRVISTFPYIAGFSTYLTLLFLSSMSFLIYSASRRGSILLSGILALVIADMFMTGSRGPVLAVAAAVIFVLGCWPVLRVAGSGLKFLLPMLMVSVATFAAYVVFPDAHAAFVQRASGADDPIMRLSSVVTEPLMSAATTGFLGFGVGAANSGALVMAAPDWIPPISGEGEWERIVTELGPGGFFIIATTRLLVVWGLWRAFRRSEGNGFRPLLLTAFLFDLLALPSEIVFNRTAGFFFWFLAGLALIPRGVGDGNLASPRVPAELFRSPSAPRSAVQSSVRKPNSGKPPIQLAYGKRTNRHTRELPARIHQKATEPV